MSRHIHITGTPGGGEPQAGILVEELRDAVVVVWNDEPGEEYRYERGRDGRYYEINDCRTPWAFRIGAP